MEKEIFSMEMEQKMNNLGISLTKEQTQEFYQYMELLIEWNEKINLTAIVEPQEIILKHFVDSCTILKEIGEQKKIIDVGTGAGFPGIPIKIVKEETEVTLMDALNKRILFLDEVIQKLALKEIQTIHARAEELARQEKYRESYDVATSRAVASLSVLLEYMLPFVKVGGLCVCMKGPDILEEVESSKKALKIFGGKLEKIEEITLPGSDMRRSLILVRKIQSTPKGYPRKAGTPSKEPIV